MAKIEMGKTYKTRGGKPVRIYAVDAGSNYPVHGACEIRAGVWIPEMWNENGRYSGNHTKDSRDLIEVKPEITGWLNIYDKTTLVNTELSSIVHMTKEEANRRAIGRRIACIPITFTEGEGLEESDC